VGVSEHSQLAAHQDQRDEHHAAGDQPEAGCDIHGNSNKPTKRAAATAPDRTARLKGL